MRRGLEAWARAAHLGAIHRQYARKSPQASTAETIWARWHAAVALLPPMLRWPRTAVQNMVTACIEQRHQTESSVVGSAAFFVEAVGVAAAGRLASTRAVSAIGACRKQPSASLRRLAVECTHRAPAPWSSAKLGGARRGTGARDATRHRCRVASLEVAPGALSGESAVRRRARRSRPQFRIL